MSFVAKSVLHYDSIAMFFADFYKQRKLQNGRFSYESWCRQVTGINKSLLMQISTGARKIPDDKIQNFINFFKFTPKEKRHFEDLIVAAKSGRTSAVLQKRISAQIQYQENLFILQNSEDFLRNDQIPILATLISFEDIKLEVNHLAKLLGKSAKTVRAWMQVLENLSFVKKLNDKSWKALKTNFRVPSELGKETLIRYHQSSLKRASGGLSQPLTQRHYESLLLPMDAEEYQDYLNLLERFRLELLARFNAKTLGSRKLYQVNFAVHAVLENDLNKN